MSAADTYGAIVTGGRRSESETASASDVYASSRTGGTVSESETATAGDAYGASRATYPFRFEDVRVWSVYTYELRDANDRLVWTDRHENLVVDEGLVNLLNLGFHAGSGVGPPWYLGLINGAAPINLQSSDVCATLAGFTEFTGYTGWPSPPGTGRIGYTPALAVASLSGGEAEMDNLAALAAFPITAPGTIAGAFLSTAQDVAAQATGTLYSEGTFIDGGRAVNTGDTLNVSLALQLAAT